MASCARLSSVPKCSAGASQAGHVQDRDVALGVVEDDLRGVRAAAAADAARSAATPRRPRGRWSSPGPGRRPSRCPPGAAARTARCRRSYTMLAAARTPGRCAPAPGRAGDRRIGSGPRVSKTCGKPLWASGPRKLVNSGGRRRHDVARTPTHLGAADRARDGPVDARTRRRSTRPAGRSRPRWPRRPSAGVDGLGRGRGDLAAQPGAECAVSACPTEAHDEHTTDQHQAAAQLVASPSQSPSRCGSSHTASGPPPRKPTNDSAPTRSPAGSR